MVCATGLRGPGSGVRSESSRNPIRGPGRPNDGDSSQRGERSADGRNANGVVAWKEVGSDRPFPRLLQAILMLLGMPRAVKRLMQRTATLASTFWRSKLRERRLGPMRVL